MIRELLKDNKKEKVLFCFSPEIMLFTFISEFILAIYTIVKYRKTAFGRAVALTLIMLGIFQLSEYQICAGTNSLLWSRIGLFAITLLPVLGIYLISILNKNTYFVKIGYVIALAFGSYFLFMPKAVNDAVCGGNYVIISGQEGLYGFWGYYYFGFLLLALWEAMEGIKKSAKKKVMKQILFWFIIGYLSFILPLTLVYIFVADSRNGVASIMCGFAIFFAFILALKIAPLYHKIHGSSKNDLL